MAFIRFLNPKWPIVKSIAAAVLSDAFCFRRQFKRWRTRFSRARKRVYSALSVQKVQILRIQGDKRQNISWLYIWYCTFWMEILWKLFLFHNLAILVHCLASTTTERCTDSFRKLFFLYFYSSVSLGHMTNFVSLHLYNTRILLPKIFNLK